MEEEFEGWDMEDIYDDVEPEQGYTAEDIFGDDNYYEEIYSDDDDLDEDEWEWDDNYGIEDTDGIDFSEDDLNFD